MDKSLQWRKVVGFEGYYVSESGALYSEKSGRILRPQMFRGYHGFLLRRDGMYKGMRLNRIVLEAFKPRAGSETLLARHMDGDRFNNHYTNLEWGTHKQNTADAIRHGTWLRGSRHPNAKLSESDVVVIRKSRLTDQALADEFGVSHSTIQRVRKGKRWLHV